MEQADRDRAIVAVACEGGFVGVFCISKISEDWIVMMIVGR